MAPLVAQQRNNNNNNQRPQRNKTEQADVETLVRLVDGVAGGLQQAPADVPIAWESNHFVKGQDGITYLPFTLNIDRSKLSKADVAFYVRVVSKTRRRRRRPRPPPKPRATPRTSRRRAPGVPVGQPLVHRGPLERQAVPRHRAQARASTRRSSRSRKRAPTSRKQRAARRRWGSCARTCRSRISTAPELATSSILVASAIEVLTAPLPPAQQEENPYVFGPMKIGLSPDGKFSKSGELNLVFWIYGAGAAAAGKPDVQIDYAFHQKLAEGEKYFNRTQPQTLNAQSLPPEFDVAAGHQLPGTLTVPLASFPSGDYRLEIKVTDKTSGKSVVQNVSFTVLPA